MSAFSDISELEHASLDNNKLNEFTAEDLKLLPKIHPNGPLYTRIFEMAMDKIVSVLMKMSSEKRYNNIAKHLTTCKSCLTILKIVFVKKRSILLLHLPMLF